MKLTITETMIALVLAGLLTFACSKWNLERIGFTNVITIGTIEVGSNSAFLIGDIEDIRTTNVVETGFVLSSSADEDASLRLGQPNVVQFRSPGLDTISNDRAFAARAIELNGSTEYFFRAYVRLEGEEQVAYGNIDQFITLNLSIALKSIKRSSEDCNTTAAIEVILDGFIEGGDTEVGVIWTDDIYIGRPPGLRGNTLIERRSGSSPATLIFDLPVTCDNSYTVAAFAAPPSSPNKFYTELRSFSMKAAGEWLPKSNFPGEMRESSTSFAIDNTVYIGAGKKPSQKLFNEVFHLFDFWSYSAENDTWLQIGQFVDGVSNGIGASSNGIGYFGSGQWTSERCLDFSGGACGEGGECATTCHCMTGDFFKFDPENQVWSTIELPDTIGGKFRRHSATAINIGNKIYFGFGNHGLACGNILRWVSAFVEVPVQVNKFFTYSDMWQFDPATENWSEMQPFPKEERIRAIGYSIGNKGYFGLGDYYRSVLNVSNPSVGPLNDFYEFDPAQPDGSQWAILDPFPAEIEHAKSFALADLGYVLANENYDLSTSVQVWKFDRAAGVRGTWSQVSDNIQTNFAGLPAAALSIGNVALVYVAGPDQNFWMYVPELN